jgi:hypothetical protein
VSRATRIGGTTFARSAGTATVTATPIATATTIAPTTRASGPPCVNRFVSMATRTKGSVPSTRSALTSFSDTSSTAPASGVDAPMRCRNRTFIAIRPAELGTAILANLIAAWSSSPASAAGS